MSDKIEEIIETIQEAAEFLKKQSKEDRSGHHAYLFQDIQSGVSAINGILQKESGARPDFNILQLMEELDDPAGCDGLPNELAQWIEAVRQVRQPHPAAPKTQNSDSVPASGPIDRDFSKLMDSIRGKSLDELNQVMRENLHKLKKEHRAHYDATIRYYNQYKLWGRIQPERGVYELLDNRAHAFFEHAEDFEWLYRRLCDNRSRRILCNILTYWLMSDWTKTDGIVDHTFPQYFDLDLVDCRPDEVFVDVGAYIGDTLADYLNVFGRDCYQRFYCYEILPSNLKRIQALVDKYGLKNIEIRAKGASDQTGELFTVDEGTSSVGQLAESGGVKVPVVAIDDDISEPVTFIKMDIEGAEETALKGCLKKIRQCHPKLALSAYHNHKDLWKLARMIYDADPTYRFYLRYYGGNLCPTEYLLYAV